MATTLTGKKFAITHKLPVTRLVHLRYQQGDNDTIIHLCDDMTHDKTTKANTSFWHSRCGKNMDYVESSPHPTTIAHAKKQGSGIRFCSHCGTMEEFLNAFEAVTVYDENERMLERAERDAQNRASHLAWVEMCAVLGDEVGEVLACRKGVVAGERENEFVYKIKRNGVTYNVSMSISQEKK